MTTDDEKTTDEQKTSWRFPSTFWFANLMELCERAAYYGFSSFLTLYLSRVAGFSDVEAGIVGSVFYGGIYLLPPFVGAISDRIGFKRGLVLAFGLLATGYFFLGIVRSKPAVLFFLFLCMVGGSFIKPLITGTVAKTTNQLNRARAYSLFYWIVNIGSFSGKTVVPWIRQGVGLEYVNFFSAAMCLVALAVALVLFKAPDGDDERKSMREVARSAWGIITNARLMTLTLIVAGFWLIQAQMYSTMPKYVIRLLGEGAKPEWLANVNPLVVVLCVVVVTQLMRKSTAVTSIMVGMLIMPFSAAAMALSTSLESWTGGSVNLGIVLHPLTVMMIVGIALQGLAECFISPRFLEYFSLQAPKGEEGTYLGFSHLHSCISAFIAFFMSGFLLAAYCPDPTKLPLLEGARDLMVVGSGQDMVIFQLPRFAPEITEISELTAQQRAHYYSHAHHIWYYFIAVGFVSAVALVIFRAVVNRIDAEKEA